MNRPAKIVGTETVENVLDEIDAKRVSNLRIWNHLGKTDPAHTKGFSRAGGFKGTAIKPIWITQRLTELFGPCGKGWGFEKPEFQLVPTATDTLVYCTVTAWYIDGEPGQHVVYGVGGDKVVAQRQSGPFCDDEAFKKAFTDALGNAFKFVGVGADVHMGLFEDSKYLAEVTAEFHPKPDQTDGSDASSPRGEGDMSDSALRGCIKTLVHNINGCGSVRDLDELLETDDCKPVIEQTQRRFPNWWESGAGLPREFVPLKKLIEQTRDGLKQLETTE